jgi:hypothetical protein
VYIFRIFESYFHLVFTQVYKSIHCKPIYVRLISLVPWFLILPKDVCVKNAVVILMKTQDEKFLAGLFKSTEQSQYSFIIRSPAFNKTRRCRETTGFAKIKKNQKKKRSHHWVWHSFPPLCCCFYLCSFSILLTVNRIFPIRNTCYTRCLTNTRS